MSLHKYLIGAALIFGQLLSGIVYCQTSLQIKGTIELDTGTIWFLEEKELGLDTLGSAKIKKGTFVFKKIIDSEKMVKISIEGYQGGIDMFLEPGINYKVHLKKSEPSLISGGKLNKSYQTYIDYARQYAGIAKRMKDSVDNARSIGHFKTAKRLREQSDSLLAQSQIPLDSIIRTNRHNVLGAHLLLSKLSEDDDLTMLQNTYSRLSSEAQHTQPAKNLAHKIKRLSNLREGSIIADFELKDEAGQVVSLYSIKGKLKIIDFWASWCGPCRLENPNMVSLYNDFKDKGLKIISISLDEKKENWNKAILQDHMTWNHLSSLKGWSCEVGKLFNVTAVPAIFILDEQNKLLKVNLRGAALRSFVAEYL